MEVTWKIRFFRPFSNFFSRIWKLFFQFWLFLRFSIQYTSKMIIFHLQTFTVWHDFCGTKKNSASWFDFFFYVLNDSATYVEDFGIPFLQTGSFFWSFRKFTKKSILDRFSCIFPYRELIGKIHQKTLLSTTYMGNNMPSKCLKNAKFYSLCFLLKK